MEKDPYGWQMYVRKNRFQCIQRKGSAMTRQVVEFSPQNSSTDSKEKSWAWMLSVVIVFLAVGLLLRLRPLPQTQMQTPATTHQHHHHQAQEIDPAMQAKLAADKRESEFNHHLAGFLVALAGTFIIAQGAVVKKWPATKYVWPACFLVSGIFLLIFSDTELWPFGHREWLEALRNNREVLQHKLFSALLFVLGIIEWRRVRGVLKWTWSQWVFPALAIVGSVLLLFHQHEGGMHGSNHMELMARIQSEHLSYSMVGTSIGLTKGLALLKTPLQVVFAKMWPLLMVLLGVLLMFYQE
jgi:hypothetical protein